MHLRQFPEMLHRLSINMGRKGSITVFLSLLLILMFSFVLTALEAARIRGATAYISMLSGLAGDSFLASYYYPLFQEYRLFGVNAGNEKGFLEESILTGELDKNLSCGMKEGMGGLIRFTETGVQLDSYETMLAQEEAEFLSQVKSQVALDGLSLALSELFPLDDLQEAGSVGVVYRQQEETMEAVATVTEELLELMELTDGIRMKKQGIAFDKHGKMQVNDTFIKQLAVMEQGELKAAYDNAEVFRCCMEKFYRADRAAGRIRSLLSQAASLESDISFLEEQSYHYQCALADKKRTWEEGEKEQVKQALEEAERQCETYEEQKSKLLSDAHTEYTRLKKKLEEVKDTLEEALKLVELLEVKQKTARLSVQAYEVFLQEKSSVLSGELYQYFSSELERMKVYTGMEEKGYSTEQMKKSLETDINLLEAVMPVGFCEDALAQMYTEMETILQRMPEYTVDGLWFSYGDIVVAETPTDNVLGTIASLLSTGILSLVGISEQSVSGQKLSGKDLVTAGMEKSSLAEELLSCIPDAVQLLENGNLAQAVKNAGDSVWEGMALELYAMKYFHCFLEKSPYTKLNYEREYLLFGAEKDKTNLLYMVLTLTAVRMLFCMVMILKQPERMESLEAVSLGIAGFTGMPALGAFVKYSLLVLWSVEEALVEVAALLQGKRIALLGSGCILLEEIFLCNGQMIAQKAAALSGTGPGYQEYIALLLLTRGTKLKAYRAMDLIQENIRYRYNDSFRIRNLVTKLDFTTCATIKKQFDTGVFEDIVYRLTWQEKCAY